jgi:FkbM family methyltransferase
MPQIYRLHKSSQIHKIFIKFIDLLFIPFYKWLNFCPLNIKFINYPIYKQIQFIHFKNISKYHNFDETVKINTDNNIHFQLICNASNGFSQMQLIQTGVYEKNITNIILQNLKENNIFVDIGANIGYYSVLASKILNNKGKIISFEPVKETFNKLIQNIKLNNINEQLTAYNCALGNKTGTENINLHKESGHNSVVRISKLNNIGKEQIKIKKFDQLINFKNKDLFIKIDVEAYEFEVLKGMENTLKNNNCKIIFEFTPTFYKDISDDYINYSTDILNYLKSADYQIFNIKKNKLIKINDNRLFVVNLKEKQVNLFAKKTKKFSKV